jgi:hypothetical protein
MSPPEFSPIVPSRAREWILCDPASFPDPVRVLVFFNLNIPFVFAESAGRLLLLEQRLNVYRYSSPQGDLSIIVRRSFISGRFSIEINGARGKLRKGAWIPREAWSTNPIVASVGMSDGVLLVTVKQIGREDDFEPTIVTRRAELHTVGRDEVKTDATSVREKVEKTQRGYRMAINVLGGGGVLCVFGFGYFILPSLGYQFVVMRHVSPQFASAVIFAGIATIVAGCVLLVRNARDK